MTLGRLRSCGCALHVFATPFPIWRIRSETRKKKVLGASAMRIACPYTIRKSNVKLPYPPGQPVSRPLSCGYGSRRLFSALLLFLSAAAGAQTPVGIRGQQCLPRLPCRHLAQLLQESALQEHRLRQGAARAHRVRRLPRPRPGRTWRRGGGKTTIPHAFSLMQPEAGAERLASPATPTDFETANIRRSEHTLNEVACTSCHSDPPLAHAQVPAGQETARDLLRLPRDHARAVRNALPTPRQRRLHGVLRLPQSARRVSRPPGAWASGRAWWSRRLTNEGALPEMPCG